MKNQKGFGLAEVLAIFIVIGLLAGGGWYVWQTTYKNDPSLDNQNEQVTEQPDAEPAPANDESYQLKGNLLDVTMAKTVRGVQTKGQSNGEAKARFADGTYEMVATFENLPDPLEDDFYEGWLVRHQPFKFISTGKLTKTDDGYTNRFTADEDLTAFDFYVLTLEPNDGDPAPADHIVEGAMKK